MGLLDSILGGGEKHATAATKVTYPEWWLNYYRPVLDNLQRTYQQQQAQPINPLQSLAYQGITSQALGNTQQTGAAQDYLSQMMGQHPQGQPSNIPTLQSLIQGFNWNSMFPQPGQQPPAPAPAPAPAPPPPNVMAPPAIGQPVRTIDQLTPAQSRNRFLVSANSNFNTPPPLSAYPYQGGR